MIVSVFMDDKQPSSLRLAAANDLLEGAYGKPPQAVVGAQNAWRRILEVRWPPPDPKIARKLSNRSRIDWSAFRAARFDVPEFRKEDRHG